MTGYGVAGPHLGDDHSLDPPDGPDDTREDYLIHEALTGDPWWDGLVDRADDRRDEA